MATTPKIPCVGVLKTVIVSVFIVFSAVRAVGSDETLLMFVGEDLQVLSIASRREEAAWRAPAVAAVITREEIRDRGIRTLSEALDQVPGFYMAPREGGSLPYLRGIQNGILFQYDAAPLGADAGKSHYPLDYELSLAGVKRIEIVRGPGSVLWGPDAFAGIVNVVPLTGKDVTGVETGLFCRSPGDHAGGYLMHGLRGDEWDLFWSVSGRDGEINDQSASVIRFWGEDETVPVPIEQRYGDKQPGRSHYLEATAHFSYGGWLQASGRLSDYRSAYTVSGPEQDYSWTETREAMTGSLKLEAKRRIDADSGFRGTGYLAEWQPESDIIDKTFSQREETLYGELIYDRTFWTGKGLLTGGLSFRQSRITDAPVWDSSLPDLVRSENEGFLPVITQENYTDRLWSLFGQYHHRIGSVEAWIGLRGDDHSRYADKISRSAGLSWAVSGDWMLKAVYGTAYRTPVARQLAGGGKPDPEEIEGINFQAAFRPSPRFGVSAGIFFNAIDDHIVEDYRGLSTPNRQDICGVELEIRGSPIPSLELAANATLLHNTGPDEIYLYNDFSFIRPDGSVERHFATLADPYDPGPPQLVNLMATWKPDRRLTVFARIGYAGERILVYPGDPAEGSEPADRVSGGWRLDGSLTIRDFFLPGLDLTLSGKNLTHADTDTPGTYALTEEDPLTVEAVIKKTW